MPAAQPIFAHLTGRASRLAILTATASLCTVAVAAAQDWNGYPPQGAYAQGPYGQGGYAPYPQNPYPRYPQGSYNQGPYNQAPDSQGGYTQQPYAQNSYGPGPYAQNGYQAGYAQPYANPYDPYVAQRAWRRQAQTQNLAYAAPPRAPAYARAPVAEPTYAEAPANAPPPSPAVAAAPIEAPPAAAAAVATNVASAPPAMPTPSAAAAAPQPAAPQSVALAHRIVESASAYLAYMQKASDIHAGFADGGAVAHEVKTGAAYEAKQFEEGAIAYAAIVALQEPAFVRGVRAASGGDPTRVQAIAAGLLANPGSAVSFSGADAAAARASTALRRQGDRLMEAGTKVKQAAYDVQHSDWSKGDVSEPDVRLAGAKTLSSTRLVPARDETDKLLKLVLSEQGGAAYPGEGAISPVVSRGLALAALAVLGQAGEDGADRVAPLLAEEKGGECLKMAKLNLFQCLAVAGPHYEDIFCLGQHAMMDTAQCVIAASGVSRPVMTAAAASALAPAAETPAPQGYWVPLGASTQVSEEAARR
jgi:hypothetical protein